MFGLGWKSLKVTLFTGTDLSTWGGLYNLFSSRRMWNLIMITRLICHSQWLSSLNRPLLVNGCLWLKSTAKECYWAEILQGAWISWWDTVAPTKTTSPIGSIAMISVRAGMEPVPAASHSPREKDKFLNVKSIQTTRSSKQCNTTTWASFHWTICATILRTRAELLNLTKSRFKHPIKHMVNNSNSTRGHTRKTKVSKTNLKVWLCRG